MYGDSAPSLNVELSTCSQCSTCHALLYDEQIMSGWNGDEANYKTTCPYCSSQLVASLTITTRQVLGGEEGGGGGRGFKMRMFCISLYIDTTCPQQQHLRTQRPFHTEPPSLSC